MNLPSADWETEQSPPDGLMRALGWDLSNPRPDEWGRMDAARWTEAINLVNAYHEGVQDAQAEAGAVRSIASEGQSTG